MSKLLDRISRVDIEVGYNLSANNVSQGIISEFGLRSILKDIYDNFSEKDGIHVVYRIDIIMPSGESVLDFVFVRHLFPQRELWSSLCISGKSVIGRVVYNVHLNIRVDYQRRGLAKIIYKLEDVLYRKWGANEIQMTAARQGKSIWRGFGFLIHCDDIYIVEYFYEEWCRENGINYVALNNTMLYPKEFLMCSKIKNFRMYKELS